MRVEKKVLCRGEAKVFVLISINDCDTVLSRNNLRLMSETKEGLTPLEWIPATSLSNNKSYEIICVLSQSRFCQTVIVRLCDNSGQIVDECHFSIESIKSSIESKYFGIKDRGKSQLIRNIDYLRDLNDYDLRVDDISYAIDTKWLMHFSIDAEKLDTENLTGYCWIESALARPQKVILDPIVIHGESKRAHFVTFFSAYIDKVAYGVFDSSCNNWCAFDALEGASFKPMKKAFVQRHQSASLDPNYGIWFKNRRDSRKCLQQQTNTTMDVSPLFSIIVPLYKTPVHFFIEMVESVLRQSYKNWELILINASAEDAQLFQIAEKYACQYENIIHYAITENLGITENTNIGIELSKGDYLCFFDHDDVLEPSILFEYAKAISQDSEIGVLYCDEDKLLPNGTLSQPTFKPDFNLDLLRDNNYVCHLLTVKKSIHAQLSRAESSVDGAQDYSLALQMVEIGAKFYHVPKVLYHWRISANSTAANSNSKPYATQAGILALQNHLDRMGISAVVENSHGRDFRYKINYNFEVTAISLVVILNKKNECFRAHLKAIAQMLSKYECEIIVVTEDSNSSCVDNSLPLVQIPCEETESFARKLERALGYCSYENIFVLSGDYCFEQTDWVDTFLGHLQRREVAVVAPMICDVAGMIREAGRTYLPTTFVPLSKGIFKEAPGYIYRPLSTQDVSLVSSCCFATKKSVLTKYASFDDDVNGDSFVADFCFECSENSLLAVYTPEITAIQFREDYEVDLMDACFMTKWASKLSKPDPFFNPNFAKDPYWASQYALDGIAT